MKHNVDLRLSYFKVHRQNFDKIHTYNGLFLPVKSIVINKCGMVCVCLSIPRNYRTDWNKIYKNFPYIPQTKLGNIGIFCFNIPYTFIMTAIRMTSIYVSLCDFPSYNEKRN